MKTKTETMWRAGLFFLMTLFVVANFPSSALAESFRWTTIDVPGAIGTLALGINPQGEIVGQYQISENEYHGFRLSSACNWTRGRWRCKDVFTTIDFPGADKSSENWAVDINPFGAIVGKYRKIGEDTSHGYLFNGVFTSIDPHGSVYTEAAGINPRGEIVGLYYTADGSYHGFHLYKGAFTTIDFPGAMGTITAAVNLAGEMVGWYDDTSGSHGFLLSKGVFTPIDFPGAASTMPFGINAPGEIMGTYVDTNGAWHGFLLRKGTYTTIDPPGSVLTFASGNNSVGDIVGAYFDANGLEHGFLLKREKR